jgi:hypothetical protein
MDCNVPRLTLLRSIVAIPTNEVLTLSYRTGPTSSSSALSTCSTSCPLSHDTSIPYEDFLISGSGNGTTIITGFEITLNTHYGTQSGLHLLQLLSAGSISYSIDTQNTGYGQGVCSSGPYPVYGRSSSTHVETSSIPWNHHDVPSTVVSGTGEGMICAPTPVDTDPEDSAVATWYPYVAQDGTYDISFFTPACSFDATCGQRGFVDVTVEITGTSATTTQMTTIDQEVTFDTWNNIYTGTVDPISQNQEVKVTMRLSSSRRAILAADKGDKYYLIADKVLVIAKETNGGGSTIVKVGSGANQIETVAPANRNIAYARGYGVWEWPIDSTSTASPTIDATSRSAHSLPLHSSATDFDDIGFVISSGSSILNIQQSPDGAFTALMGSFNYTTSALSAQSILLMASGGLLKVPNGGLSGSVSSAAFAGGYLYVAGDFNSTADGRVNGLNGRARTQYASLLGAWEAVPGSSGDSLATAVTPLGDDLLFAYNGQPISIWSASSLAELSGMNSTTTGNFSVAQTALNGQIAYLAGDLQSLNEMLSSPIAMLSKAGLAGRQLPFDKTAASSSPTSVAPPSAMSLASSSAALTSGLKNRLSRRQATSNVLAVPSSIPSSSFSNTTGPTILASTFWTNSSTKEESTIIGGRFALNGGATSNVAVVQPDGSVQPLTTEQAFGTMRQLLVIQDTLWLGGDSSELGNAQSLYSYNLATGALTPFPLSPSGDAYVTALMQKDDNTVVAGYFSSVAGVSCPSICEYNSATQSWTTYSEGLRGVVTSMVQADVSYFRRMLMI